MENDEYVLNMKKTLKLDIFTDANATVCIKQGANCVRLARVMDNLNSASHCGLKKKGTRKRRILLMRLSD